VDEVEEQNGTVRRDLDGQKAESFEQSTILVDPGGGDMTAGQMTLVAVLMLPSVTRAEDIERRWSLQVAGGQSSPVGVSDDFETLWTPGFGFAVRASYDLNRSFAAIGGLEYATYAFNFHNDYGSNTHSGSVLVTGDASSILSGRVALKATPLRWVLAPYVLVGGGVSNLFAGSVTEAWTSNYCRVGPCAGSSSLPSASHLSAFAFIGSGVDIRLGRTTTIFGEATLRILHSGGSFTQSITGPSIGGLSIEGPTNFSVMAGLSFRL
jgi:hypothetical protein